MCRRVRGVYAGRYFLSLSRIMRRGWWAHGCTLCNAEAHLIRGRRTAKYRSCGLSAGVPQKSTRRVAATRLPVSHVVPCIVPVLFVVLFFNWTPCVCRQPNRRPNLGVSCACSRKAGGCVTLRFNEVSLLCLAKSYPGTKLPGVTLNKTHNLSSNITLSHRISMLLVTRDHSGMQPWQRRA